MENLKVKVNSEAESKEVQELFFELGCYIDYPKKCLDDAVILFSESCGLLTYSSTETYTNDGTTYKEITPQQLRDLVVLKRNNVNDATHSDQDGWKWYIGADSYVWQAGNSQQLKQWDQSSLDMVDLEPINKEISETEYLMQGKNGERLMESVGQLKGVEATLAQRQSEYGSFEDVAFVTENIMSILAKVRVNGLQDLPNTHRMALYMIASKMARIVNGDFNKLDSWHDIGGYSKLIENLIEGK